MTHETIQVPPRPLLIGELNPYGADPRFALYPLPEHSAGGRLCSLILGMDRGAYVRSFDRRNLCTGKWSMKAARAAADEIITRIAQGAPLILCGTKVTQAFGFEFKPWFSFEMKRRSLFMLNAEAWSRVVILPHPSGLCRLWNEPRAVERTRELVLAVAPQLAGYIGRRAA